MIDRPSINAALREVTRKHLCDIALRAALRPHSWFWYYTAAGRDERDLMRWADDGGNHAG